MKNEIIAKLAWKLSGEYKYGYNIGCLCSDLARDLGFEFPQDAANEIRAAIYDYLTKSSEEIYTEGEGSEAGKFGYISELGIYWANTNAYFEWYSDRPDWWDEMVEKQNDCRE